MSEKKLIVDNINELNEFIMRFINNNYRLITISSFGIVLANFSKNGYDLAFNYGVTSSFLFIISFIFQFLKEIQSERYKFIPAGFSTIFMLFGVIYLFLIPLEYAKDINLIGLSYLIILVLVTKIFIITLSLEGVIILIPSLKCYINNRKTKYNVKIENMSLAYLSMSFLILFYIVLNILDLLAMTLSVYGDQKLIEKYFILNQLLFKFNQNNVQILLSFILVLSLIFELIITKLIFKKKLSDIKTEFENDCLIHDIANQFLKS